MDINHNLIPSCPLCKIFLNPEESMISKLYYSSSDTIKTSDFIIMGILSTDKPIVVVRDHVPTISSDLWGKIVYACRKQYGGNVRLKSIQESKYEHFYSLIII